MSFYKQIKNTQKEYKTELNDELVKLRDKIINDLNQSIDFEKNVSNDKKNANKDTIQDFIYFLVDNVYRVTKNSEDEKFVILDTNHNNTIKEPIDRMALIVNLNSLYIDVINLFTTTSFKTMINIISVKNIINHIDIKYDYHSKDGLSFTKKVIGRELHIFLTDNVIPIKLPSNFEIEYIEDILKNSFDNVEQIIDDVINEYTIVHNPHYDNLYKLLVARKFASKPRNYIVYNLKQGGSGKTFDVDIRVALGISCSISVANLLMNPSPLTLKQLDNKFAFDFDDKKAYWDDELRTFMGNVYFTPKYGTEITLQPVILILNSADPLKELEGSVEIQNADRTNKFRTANFKLENRPMFKMVGRDMYFNIIGAYSYNLLKTFIDEYLALPKYKATEKADKLFEEIYSKYGLSSTVDNLLDKIKELVITTINDCVNSTKREFYIKGVNLKDYIKRDPTNKDIVYVSHINTVYSYMLENADNPEFTKQAKNTYPIIDDRMFDVSDKISMNAEITKKYKMPQSGILSNLYDSPRKEVTIFDLSKIAANHSNLNDIINPTKEIEIVVKDVNDKVIETKIVSKDEKIELNTLSNLMNMTNTNKVNDLLDESFNEDEDNEIDLEAELIEKELKQQELPIKQEIVIQPKKETTTTLNKDFDVNTFAEEFLKDFK